MHNWETIALNVFDRVCSQRFQWETRRITAASRGTNRAKEHSRTQGPYFTLFPSVEGICDLTELWLLSIALSFFRYLRVV